MQMGDALAAAHAAGIVHRDLKPGNLMVTEAGLVKRTEVAESGYEATLSLEHQTEEGMIVGTVSYMSPEQAEGKKVDGRSDIFSFGSVLYEMTTVGVGFRQASGSTCDSETRRWRLIWIVAPLALLAAAAVVFWFNRSNSDSVLRQFPLSRNRVEIVGGTNGEKR